MQPCWLYSKPNHIHCALICFENLFKQQKQIKDPLANMIYDPILCRRGSADFLYFEINSENIESFKFGKPTVDRLVLRSIQSYDGKIRFMAYNNRFLAGLHNLSNAGYIAFIHLFLNMMIFYVIQYYVYERLLGLKLFRSHWI